jgi:predicted ester cyclase
MGVAPTGKELAFSGTVIDRFLHGKVVEAWETVDMLGLMRQLGATAASE